MSRNSRPMEPQILDHFWHTTHTFVAYQMTLFISAGGALTIDVLFTLLRWLIEGSAHFKSHQVKYSTNYTVIPAQTNSSHLSPIGPIGNIPSHFPPCSGSKQGSAMGLSGPQAWRQWTVWFPLAAGSVSWSSVIDRPARRPSPLTPSSTRRPSVRRQFITMAYDGYDPFLNGIFSPVIHSEFIGYIRNLQFLGPAHPSTTLRTCWTYSSVRWCHNI